MTWRRRLRVGAVIVTMVVTGYLVALWLPFPDSFMVTFAIGVVVGGPLILWAADLLRKDKP